MTNPRNAQSAHGDEHTTPFFCRALYDFASDDAATLAFCAGDVIEVLGYAGSGWWDGLRGGARGWFPSNYIEVIPDAMHSTLPRAKL